ncbi:hypothetical protein HDV06_006271 [Boothiomyces sp. JEL0866]|nr:hypothetical protein HDV06_006271 [Boothiomyces sp. JEL0866]
MFLTTFSFTQIVQLFALSVALSVHVVVLCITAVKWKFLPRIFRIITLISVSFLFVGTLQGLYFAISYNSLEACVLSRKTLFVCVYLGFFMFDVYQTLKIKTISGNSTVSTALFGILLSIRLVSYVVNIYYVTGSLVALSNGLGACKTILINDWQVYQEHLLAIAFELGLVLYLVKFILRTRVANTPLQSFIANIIDHELISFALYFIVELLYIGLFQFQIIKQWVSVLNSLYFVIPSALYLFNIVLFGKVKKIKGKPSSGAKSKTKRSMSSSKGI